MKHKSLFTIIGLTIIIISLISPKISSLITDGTDLQLEPATVIRVVDGDTILAQVNGQKEKIRFIGIDTPETVNPRTPVEYYGPEASAYTKQILPEGKQIYLEYDKEKEDKYGRTLAYVWLSRPPEKLDYRQYREYMVNANLLAQGYAVPVAYKPNTKYQNIFEDLALPARETKIGVWGAPATISNNLNLWYQS